MNTYICKCGKEIRTNSTAAVTGNRLENYAAEHKCFGCPYVVEVQKWTKYPEFEIIHECEMSKRVFHRTVADGFDDSTRSCSVQSLDFDFLRKVSDYCVADEHLTINREENGNIFGYKSSYQANGLYRLPIYPTSNKAGVAAKKAVFECFFNEDGAREDTGGADETEIVQAQIARGKELAQMEQGEDVPDINVASMPEEITYQNFADIMGAEFISNAFGLTGTTAEEIAHECDYENWDGDDITTCICCSFNDCSDCPVGGNCTPVDSEIYILEYLVQQWEKRTEKHTETPDPDEIATAHNSPYAKHPYTFIAGDSPERPEMKEIFFKEHLKPNGCARAIHFCKTMPKNDSIWYETVMGHWCHSVDGNLQGIRVESCPFCDCNLNNDEGDVYIYRYENEPYVRKEEHAEQSEPTEETVATDTNVEDKPEQPEPDNRSTLVASPLDFASAALAPAFDYSDLDPKTVDTLHVAESIIFDARKYYLAECANAVGIAHDALCGRVATQCRNSKHGNRGNETFGAWCESVGLNRKTAERFLHVNNLIKNATDEEQAILEQAPKTLLYAAANPNAPTELVEAVKQGDITSNAEYQKLLAEKKAAEARADEEREKYATEFVKVQTYFGEKLRAEQTLKSVTIQLEHAEKRAEEAEEKRKRFQASSNEANQLAYEKISELNKLKKEIESRPIDVAVQQPSEADIARYRAEGAKAATAEWQERYEDIEAQNHAYKDMMREKDAQIAELVAYEPDQDLLGDTAATMQEFGKHTAQIMETALRLFFDAAADKPDFIYNPAAQYLYDIHTKFSQALNFGKWPEDEGSEQDELE